MSLPFANKVIAITGGASGIGLATARILLSKGASLAISDINSQALSDTKAELSAKSSHSQKVTTTVVDVSKSHLVDKWIGGIIKDHGKLNHAANVAGLSGHPGFLTELSDEDFHKTIDINLSGVFYCMRAQLKVMERGSSIVNVSSGAGLVGIPRQGAYTAAKHGVHGLTKTAAKEFGPQGIRINAVAPGLVKTGLWEATEEYRQAAIDNCPLRRHAEPEQIAQAIVHLLSDDASFQSGSITTVDGGNYS